MTRLFITALITLTLLHGQAINTPSQYESWAEHIQRILANGSRKANMQAGEIYTYGFSICADNEWMTVIFTVTALAGGAISFNREPLPSGQDCDPSKDDEYKDLSNPKVIKEIEQTVRQVLQKEGTPVKAAVPDFYIAPRYRNVLFQPLYASSAVPDRVPCAPSNNATAFLVNHSRGSLTRIRTCNYQIVATIPILSSPLQVETVPDGSLALVTSFDSGIVYVDTATNSVVSTMRTPGASNPSGIAISPDGATAYVTSFNIENPVLMTINIAKQEVTGTLRLQANYPHSAFVIPDGSQVWVTHPLDGMVSIVDTLTNTSARTIPIRRPQAIAFNATGTRAYISSSTSPGSLLVIDTATLTVLKTIALPDEPVDVRVLPEDRGILVNNFAGRSISLVDPEDFSVKTFPLGRRPRGIGIVQ